MKIEFSLLAHTSVHDILNELAHSLSQTVFFTNGMYRCWNLYEHPVQCDKVVHFQSSDMLAHDTLEVKNGRNNIQVSWCDSGLASRSIITGQVLCNRVPLAMVVDLLQTVRCRVPSVYGNADISDTFLVSAAEEKRRRRGQDPPYYYLSDLYWYNLFGGELRQKVSPWIEGIKSNPLFEVRETATHTEVIVGAAPPARPFVEGVEHAVDQAGFFLSSNPKAKYNSGPVSYP